MASAANVKEYLVNNNDGGTRQLMGFGVTVPQGEWVAGKLQVKEGSLSFYAYYSWIDALMIFYL